MALPSLLDPSAPTGSASPAQGDDEFRAVKLYLVDVFGVPNNANVTAAAYSISTAGVVTISQSPFNVPTLMRGNASSILMIESRYSNMSFDINGASIMNLTATGMLHQTRYVEWASGLTGVLGTVGAQPLILRSNTLDRWAVNPSGMLVPVPSTLDIGTLAGPNPRNVFIASNISLGGQLQAGSQNRAVTTPTGMLDARELSLAGPELRGDLLLRGASAWTRLAAGATGRVLKSAGANADLVFDTLDVSDVSSAVTLATAQTISGAKTFSTAPIISSTTGIDFTVGGAGTIGTTDAQDFQLKSRGIVRWRINASGMLLAQTDNVFDLGASGATRPRDIYAAGNYFSGANQLTSGNLLDAAQLTIASQAQGDVLIRSSSAWTRLAAGTSGQYLRTRGGSADPLWVTDDPGTGVTTSSNPVLWTGEHDWNSGSDFSFSSPSARLAIGTGTPTQMLHVFGRGYVGSHLSVVGQIRAGTGDNVITTAAGLVDFATGTIASEAQGDVLSRGASAWTRLAAGTSGQLLRTRGASADPLWATGFFGTGLSSIQVIRKTADQTVNNSTVYVNDSGLSFSLGANERVYYLLFVIYNSGLTPDFKYRFTLPASAVNTVTAIGMDEAAAGVTGDVFIRAAGDRAVGGTVEDATVRLVGHVVGGGTAGTVQLQWAQNAAAASDTIARAQSFILLFRE